MREYPGRSATLFRLLPEANKTELEIGEKVKVVGGSDSRRGEEGERSLAKSSTHYVNGPKESRTNEMWGGPDVVKAMLVRMLWWLYSRVVAVVYGGAPRRIATIKSSLLMESSSSLASRIRNRKVSSVEVVQSYIERIREVNEVLNCVVDERFEDALSEARKADELVLVKTAEELERESPLLGVPFTSPEAVAVAGLYNTMGATSRSSCRAKADAGAVGLLRAAGAIPIACTNVSEWCLLWETSNPVFGRTCNPYDTNRSAGGPFGGEGCLIAACGSPLGIAPSVTLPCAFNGIFGHKPSEGASCDGVGPMSRSAADLLPALRILTKNSGVELRLGEAVDLKALKYYFMDSNGGSSLTSSVDDQIKQAIQKAVNHFRNAINASVERVDLKQLAKAYPIWMAHTRAYRTKPQQLNLFKELLLALFGKSHHTPAFLLSALSQRTINSNGDFQALRQDRNLLFQTLQDMLGSNGVFIYPTHPSSAPRHNESCTKESDFGYAGIFEALGLPATHCPAGLHSDGLPIGFQVVAALNQDRVTVAVAREIEKALKGWTPPLTQGTFTLKNTLFCTASNQKLKVL